MVVCYNFQLLQEEEVQISLVNRAFQYNDGVFETILFTKGKVRFLESHLSRLQKAAEVLKIDLPGIIFELETVAFWVEKLIAKNQLSGNIRIKLKVWRKGKGLYTPEENGSEVLITAEPHQEISNTLDTADFAETINTHFSSYSFFKGPNSIQYVLAGIEKKQRNLDEIILLSSEGFVSECLVSNIFWVKNNAVFTPAIETGCIAGIMRENLIKLFQAKNILFQEGKFLPEELLDADSVFTTNAAGIKVIKKIENQSFKTESEILSLAQNILD